MHTDRQVLVVLAALIHREIHLDLAALTGILTAMTSGYVLLQEPGAWLAGQIEALE